MKKKELECIPCENCSGETISSWSTLGNGNINYIIYHIIN